jgi:transglutaminase-like putative cysteine protease
MTYSIRHVTSFRYEPAIRESLMEVRMQPRSDARQRCLAFSLDVTPQTNTMAYRDFFGNTVHHFDIPGLHAQIQVKTEALVDVTVHPFPDLSSVGSWQDLDARISTGELMDMLLPSAYARPTEKLDKLAQEIQWERRGNPFECVLELNDALFRSIEYAPNTTKVDSPIDDALRARRGVCQDFAHIMIALLRKHQIPGRYVSGYLFHAEESHDRSSAGATHAWVEAFLPSLGWMPFDPTNSLLCGERHIRVAVGRDYADVPPTRGVYKGEAESELSVSVIVSEVDSPAPQELPPATVIRSRPVKFDSMDPTQGQQQQ